ncbi:hypothetical protein [uncultured Dokdonia sp.]|uniref:hypothetical protein n=1 Tax=Dokdonia sp. Asnod2-E02 TaxID=3160574 RepID=UPI00260C2740|nr:hypothetical protein [uncultured Dokdonia sp.]
MILRTLFIAGFLLTATVSTGQNTFGGGGSSTSSNSVFNQKMNLGYKAGANRVEDKKVDGSPYLFENWDRSATVVTKAGENLKIENVNFDGRRNKIVAKINSDSIYTFNSLAIDKAIINGKTFVNIEAPNSAVIKVYELVVETPEFKILKDHVVDINEGSSNPMRGTTIARYIPREFYMLLKNDSFERFSLRKKKILKLLAAQEEKVKTFVDQNDLNYKNEDDINKIMDFYTGL